MPGPAARLGDPTMHGGAISLGMPTVLIGGMPAARLTDMHLCPFVTPGTPPIPHVGGPIIGPGVPTVLIGNLPAATLGDMATCVGPPATILMGCPTVIIGMAGTGAGSSGSAGAGGGAGAAASAAAAALDANESTTREEHWVEVQFVDKAGNAVSGVPYEFKSTDGGINEGVLRVDGRIRRDALEKDGSCEVVLFSIYDARWSKSSIESGETVKMEAKVEGFPSGSTVTFTVFRRSLHGPDQEVFEITATTSGESVSAEWTHEIPKEEQQVLVPAENAEGADVVPDYQRPDYYFEAHARRCRARSALLGSTDTFEVEVVDERGDPLRDATYVLHLEDGSVRKGKLDGSGKLKEDGLPAGTHDIRFPDLPDVEPK